MTTKKKRGGNALLKNSDNIYVQSNRLVEAHYKESLTQWEMFLFTKMCAMISPEDTDFKHYKIYIKEVLDYLNVQKGGYNYKYVIEAAQRLLDRRITIYYVNDAGKKIAVDTHLVTSVHRLAEPTEEENENLYISLTFPPELRESLLQLKDNFTILDLEVFKFLKTPTSVRMYQLLTSHLWKREKKVEYNLEELKKKLGVADKYDQYGAFKVYVLDEAQKRLGESTNLSFTYSEVKSGRKVTTIVFYLTEHNKSKPEQNLLPQKGESSKSVSPEVAKDTELLIVELSPIVVSKFGVSLKVFMNLVEQNTEGDIRQAVKVTEKAIKTGKIDNVAGFFVEAVRGHFTDTEEQKQKKQTEVKIKIDTIVQQEARVGAQKRDLQKIKYEKKRAILAELVLQDADFVSAIIDELKHGMTGQYYKEEKSLDQNMENPLFAAAFLNMAEKLKPEKFEFL
jgi:plasmid replication initiation protein